MEGEDGDPLHREPNASDGPVIPGQSCGHPTGDITGPTVRPDSDSPVRQCAMAPRRTPVVRVLRPLRDFLRTEAASGALLVAAAVAALVWANSPWRDTYHDLWTTVGGFSAGGFTLSLDLRHWVNDGLMTFFSPRKRSSLHAGMKRGVMIGWTRRYGSGSAVICSMDRRDARTPSAADTSRYHSGVPSG